LGGRQIGLGMRFRVSHIVTRDHGAEKWQQPSLVQMVGGMEQPRAGRHRHGYAALIEKAEKVQRTPLGAHWILCELSLYMQCAALVKMREGKSRAKGIGQDTPRILGGSPKNVQM